VSQDGNLIGCELTQRPHQILAQQVFVARSRRNLDPEQRFEFRNQLVCRVPQSGFQFVPALLQKAWQLVPGFILRREGVAIGAFDIPAEPPVLKFYGVKAANHFLNLVPFQHTALRVYRPEQLARCRE